MKLRPLARLSAAAVLLISGTAGIVVARGAAEPEDPAKAMKKQMAAMMAGKGQPGEAHKHLEPMVGTFDVELAFSFGPSMPPMSLKARQTGRWILGKRFVEVVTVPAADEDLKMESMSIFGYDSRSSDYFWFGIDNTDTYSVFAQGKYDEATKTFTLTGTNEEPGKGKVPFKLISAQPSNDAATSEIWFQVKDAPGADKDGWFKVVTMNRKRVN